MTPPTAHNKAITLDERWQIHRIVGRGAEGIVYAGTDLHSQKPIAVKRYDPKAGWHGTELGRRLSVEQERTLRAQSPYLVHHIDFGTVPSPSGQMIGYTVMELLEGMTLREFMDERSGPLRPEDALTLIGWVAQGLDALHRAGYIYRDLKPENIFVLSSENAAQVGAEIKLIDLCAAVPELEAQDFATRGTPIYSAPELAARDDSVSFASDIYSLGILLFELLSGVPPVDPGATPAQIVAQHCFGQLELLAPKLVNNPVNALYTRMTQRRPRDRYEHAAAFLGALESINQRIGHRASSPFSFRSMSESGVMRSVR